jgi:hypothetical protein
MGGEGAVTETATTQTGLESQAGTGSGDDDVVMVSADQGVPPPPPTRDHEAVAPEAPETPAVVTAPTAGGVTEVPVFDNWSTVNLGVIDLDTTACVS